MYTTTNCLVPSIHHYLPINTPFKSVATPSTFSFVLYSYIASLGLNTKPKEHLKQGLILPSFSFITLLSVNTIWNMWFMQCLEINQSILSINKLIINQYTDQLSLTYALHYASKCFFCISWTWKVGFDVVSDHSILSTTNISADVWHSFLDTAWHMVPAIWIITEILLSAISSFYSRVLYFMIHIYYTVYGFTLRALLTLNYSRLLKKYLLY